MKDEAIIRIASIELENFMNVYHGKIKFPCSLKSVDNLSGSDMIGIYGQNGSGKTAFIHALYVLKQCFSGAKMPKDTAEYITLGRQSAEIHVVFFAKIDAEKLKVFYDVTLTMVEDADADTKSISISQESISYKIEGKRKCVMLQSDDKRVLSPRKIMVAVDSGHTEIDLHVAKGVAQAQHKAFLFSSELWTLLFDGRKEIHNNGMHYVCKIMGVLQNFGQEKLYVVGIKDIGLINLNLAQPFYFHLEKARRRSFGTIAMPLDRPALSSEQAFMTAKKFISDMNIVLEYLVPGLQVELHNLGKELNEKGHTVYRSELVSIRDGMEIPIRFESEGIKKILSILHVFIGAYNNPTMTIAIDELDAGIFEYLLGEMLGVFDESGKGQLIFTSHNLRPLEVLDKKSIIFTTTNPNNRYVRMTNIKTNNNLRDFYYRSIQLGGEKEELYKETNRYKLDLALRKAGRNGET
jgi:AAA15 family ATPase/GTPase